MNSLDTEKKINHDLIDGIANHLKTLSEQKYFGTVEVSFQDGQPILLRESRTMKPVILLSA